MQAFDIALDTLQRGINACRRSCLRKNDKPHSNIAATLSRFFSSFVKEHGGHSDYLQMNLFERRLCEKHFDKTAGGVSTENLLSFTIGYIQNPESPLSDYVATYLWNACIEMAGFKQNHIDYLAEQHVKKRWADNPLDFPLIEDEISQDFARRQIKLALSENHNTRLLAYLEGKYPAKITEIEMTDFCTLPPAAQSLSTH